MREALDQIAACIHEEDRSGAMWSIAEFTLLFGEFLLQNGNYIFGGEVAGLNRCLSRMVALIEAGDLDGLAETVEFNLCVFLENWDFQNRQTN